MNLGEKLYTLRKEKNLSQEEVADKLNVTRQTISKWETGESKPDFDKIIPICELYNITTDSLLKDEELCTKQETILENSNKSITKKKALAMTLSIFLYFIAVISIIVLSEPGFNEVIGVSVFLAISGVATCILVYQGITSSKENKEDNQPISNQQKNKNPKVKRICSIIEIITVIIYLFISFITMAWHITWIIFLIEGVIEEIIKLVYDMEDKENE